MMQDNELLKLAASSAGMMFIDDRREGQGLTIQETVKGKPYNYAWNPLFNDSDALRLAVKLKLDVLHHSDGGGCFAGQHNREIGAAEYFDNHGFDECAATRRAIVRAAAEVGKQQA